VEEDGGGCPMRAPGCNVPLIHVLILALYILFACLLASPTYFRFSSLLIFPYLSTSLLNLFL